MLLLEGTFREFVSVLAKASFSPVPVHETLENPNIHDFNGINLNIALIKCDGKRLNQVQVKDLTNK